MYVAEGLFFSCFIFVFNLLLKDMIKDEKNKKPKRSIEVFKELLGELYSADPATKGGVALKTSEVLSRDFSGFVDVSTLEVTNAMRELGYKIDVDSGRPYWVLFRKEDVAPDDD